MRQNIARNASEILTSQGSQNKQEHKSANYNLSILMCSSSKI